MSHQLLRWNPFSEIDAFLDHYRRDLSASARTGEKNGAQSTWQPAVDIREDEQSFVIDVDLPGMTREEVQVQVKEEILHVQGKREAQALGEGERAHRSERRFGEFQRRFTMPENVRAEGIEARFEHGVLRIVLPKVEEAQPKAFDVQVN